MASAARANFKNMRLFEFLGGSVKKPELQEKLIATQEKKPDLKRIPEEDRTGYWTEKEYSQKKPEVDYRPGFVKQREETKRLIKTAADKER
jgi:hypothetical protein